MAVAMNQLLISSQMHADLHRNHTKVIFVYITRVPGEIHDHDSITPFRLVLCVYPDVSSYFVYLRSTPPSSRKLLFPELNRATFTSPCFP